MKKLRIIRAEKGSGERIEAVKDLTIPDLWHVAEAVRAQGFGESADQIVDVWFMAHELRSALLHIEAGDDMAKPLHTK
jgi:hypothetical protein